MTDIVQTIRDRGFRWAATLREDEEHGFRFDYAPDVRSATNVVYVAVQDGADRALYVGKTVDFRYARYNYGHVRWLRGEKGNSEGQRLRWVAAVRRAPVHFYVENVHGPLEIAEARLIAELDPELNVTGVRRAALARSGAGEAWAASNGRAPRRRCLRDGAEPRGAGHGRPHSSSITSPVR